uniref:Mediator of RNA polymerase II transcription subunit 18 n=1 Tax=Acrobeloides nanus TaxID=290746 RepID=A0A914CC05_9BILA
MVFSLKTGDNPDVTVRIRRKFNRDSHLWHWRYVAAPEPDIHCPTIVRKVIDSVGASSNLMEFVKNLGLRMDYEYITQGELFIKGKIKIFLNRISYTEKPGNYDKNFLKPVTNDSYLVEASIAVPDNQEYSSAAKNLRDFCDQLLPLCNLKKVNYWQSTVQ